MNGNGTGEGTGVLEGAVVAVAGAAGPAGRATLLRLAEAGATVVGCDANPERLAEAVDAARYAHGARPSPVRPSTCSTSTPPGTGPSAPRRSSAASTAWSTWSAARRGSPSFQETALSDWDALEKLLIRTVQSTTLAFQEALERSDKGRYLLISAAGASKPTAGNAAYSAAKAAAEAWTLALGDAFRRAGGEDGPRTAAAILVVKALVNDAMRAERPNAKFAGFTDVTELAEAIAGVWDEPAPEVNGKRLWLTPQP